MTPPDRSWIVVAVGLVATAIVAAALGAVVTLWAVEPSAPIPVAHAAAPAPIPIPPPVQTAAPASAAAAPVAPAPAPAPPPAPAEAPAAAPPAAQPAAATPPAAAAAPAPVPPPVDTAEIATKLPYAVQFGAFNDDDHAQRMQSWLKGQGLPADVEFRKTPKGHDLHYVRLEDGYTTMSEAASRAAALRRQLDIEVIPVRREGAEAGQ